MRGSLEDLECQTSHIHELQVLSRDFSSNSKGGGVDHVPQTPRWYLDLSSEFGLGQDNRRQIGRLTLSVPLFTFPFLFCPYQCLSLSRESTIPLLLFSQTNREGVIAYCIYFFLSNFFLLLFYWVHLKSRIKCCLYPMQLPLPLTP